MKLVLFALVAFLAVEVISSHGKSDNNHDRPDGFLSNYDAAIERGHRLGKPVVAVFSASWCGPCQLMKSKVYPDPKVRMYLDQFVWVYLDVDDEATHSPSIRHQVRGIPSVHVISTRGKEVARHIGASSPQEFSRFLALSLAKS